MHLKLENLQRGGSFKFRGALNAILAGLEHGDERGVVTISSGNHGIAVAAAAREAGVPASIIMQAATSPLRQAAALAYGAEVVSDGVDRSTREDVGDRIHDERNLRWVHPFNDPSLIAGHGTVGLEVMTQFASASGEAPQVVVVPVGGGALLAGVAVAVKSADSSVRVVGVEPEAADDARRSREAGYIVELPVQAATMADSVNHIHLGEDPWSIIRSDFVDDVVSVGEDELLHACWLLWTTAGIAAEPAAALPIAAALSPDRIGVDRGSTLVAVVSGGNVDPAGLGAAFATARRDGLERQWLSGRSSEPLARREPAT